MTKKPALQPKLRQQAEELLRKTRQNVRDMPVEDVQELIYEFQVHQVELQMQNEELRNTQQELAASRDKYHDLYNFAPAGHMTLDASGVITEANLMAGTQLGVTHDGLIGKPFTQFIKPEYQDAYYLHNRKVFHTSHQQVCELELIRQGDARPFYVQLYSIVTPDRKGCRIAIPDITTIKNLQTELMLACEQARAANQAKSQFLANMSHEIRTPLNAIVGLTYLLKKDASLDSRQQEYVNTLQLSTDSLLALVNEILDITKIEAGKIDLEHIVFQLPQLLNDAVRLMTVKAQEKGLTLTLETHITHPCYYGDPLRIHQILLNLIGNAIKFTEKGDITIHAETKAQDGDWKNMVITVHDTGIGIPQNKIAAIFGTFTQADPSNTRKYGGTGLGLSICKKLIEQMGGTISVQSQEGKEAVFTIQLPLQIGSEALRTSYILPSPLKPAETAAILPLLRSNCNGQRPCILLVEDQKNNVLIATTLLDEFHYHYDVANTGKDALRKLYTRQYDLVLLDIYMQDMDGFEVLRVIRDMERRNNLPHIPVIAMTACAMHGDREKFLQAGMDDYLAKPFQPHELYETLERYVPALAA